LSPTFRIAKEAALIAAVWGIGALCASAQVSPATQTSPAITKPVWAALPNGDALAQYFPERAQRMGVSGRAAMKCLAGEDGALNFCQIVAESPPGFGFGSATLKVAPFFRLGAADRDGVSVAGRQITIPLRWTTPRPSPGAGAAFLTPTRSLVAWAAAPSQAQVDAAYPPGAKGWGFVGLRCVATASGALSDCVVTSERSPGQDFAVAALRLVPLFRAGPRSDGAPLEGSQVDVDLEFYPPTDAQWGDGAAQAH
jgi:hypothetical protein